MRAPPNSRASTRCDHCACVQSNLRQQRSVEAHLCCGAPAALEAHGRSPSPPRGACRLPCLAAYGDVTPPLALLTRPMPALVRAARRCASCAAAAEAAQADAGIGTAEARGPSASRAASGAANTAAGGIRAPLTRAHRHRAAAQPAGRGAQSARRAAAPHQPEAAPRRRAPRRPSQPPPAAARAPAHRRRVKGGRDGTDPPPRPPFGGPAQPAARLAYASRAGSNLHVATAARSALSRHRGATPAHRRRVKGGRDGTNPPPPPLSAAPRSQQIASPRALALICPGCRKCRATGTISRQEEKF